MPRFCPSTRQTLLSETFSCPKCRRTDSTVRRRRSGKVSLGGRLPSGSACRGPDPLRPCSASSSPSGVPEAVWPSSDSCRRNHRFAAVPRPPREYVCRLIPSRRQTSDTVTPFLRSTSACLTAGGAGRGDSIPAIDQEEPPPPPRPDRVNEDRGRGNAVADRPRDRLDDGAVDTFSPRLNRDDRRIPHHTFPLR